MSAADRYLIITLESRRRAEVRARALANADALGRGDHADATLVERGRTTRGGQGLADRIIRPTPVRGTREVVS